MVVLHLFCRTGENTFGTPLIWVTQETPLVYYFGFFAEICVPIYSICAGYAQYLYFEKGKASLKNSANKLLKLMINYWIVLFIFCGLGLIFNNDIIPGSFFDFVKSIFLLHSYNGAWWYFNTYIILLIPAGILFWAIKKIKNPFWAFSMCFGIDIVWYLCNKFDFIPELVKTSSVFSFVGVEIFNLINVLPYFWIGAFICKFKAVDYIKEKMDRFISLKYQNLLLVISFIVLFVVSIIVHKAVFMGFVAVTTFFILNLIKK